MNRTLEVLQVNPGSSSQDLGRFGYAEVGLGAAGPFDRAAHGLANRLVGNPATAATLELPFGGLVARCNHSMTLALTGAPAPLAVNSRQQPLQGAITVPAHSTIEIGFPGTGVRCYLAVNGGFELAPTLGSRSWDSLAEVGPPPVSVGQLIPCGPPNPIVPEPPPIANPDQPDTPLRLIPGPRHDWFSAAAWAALVQTPYVVAAESNRVGVRLHGRPLPRTRPAELPSEGMVEGAIQVPGSGQPIIFGPDHPVTGGYPVIAVVWPEDLPKVAQARPGTELRFRWQPRR